MNPSQFVCTRQKDTKLFRAAGIVAAVGTAPLLITIILMQLRVVDPTLNPIGLGLLMWFSCMVGMALAGVGLVRRWWARLN